MRTLLTMQSTGYPGRLPSYLLKYRLLTSRTTVRTFCHQFVRVSRIMSIWTLLVGMLVSQFHRARSCLPFRTTTVPNHVQCCP